MNFKYRQTVVLSCLLGAVLVAFLLANSTWQSPIVVAQSTPSATPVEWQPVERAIGKTGTLQTDDVFKFSFPRRDLQVTAKGVQIKPAFALGSWAAFKKMGNQAMVMGDLVLTSDEITPVMTKLQQNGIEQTAVHNHIPEPSPTIMYMHIQGQGAPVKLAQSIYEALLLTANEVNPVIRTLRKNGIEVTALHSHMLDEAPRTLYLHFWANDDVTKLARGLRDALDQTHSK
jgi:Domain of Unknown Function (DUF1259)